MPDETDAMTTGPVTTACARRGALLPAAGAAADPDDGAVAEAALSAGCPPLGEVVPVVAEPVDAGAGPEEEVLLELDVDVETEAVAVADVAWPEAAVGGAPNRKFPPNIPNGWNRCAMDGPLGGWPSAAGTPPGAC